MLTELSVCFAWFFFLSGLFNKHQNPKGASWQRQINFLAAHIISLSLSVGTAPTLSSGCSLHSALCLHHQITNHITSAVILRRAACLHSVWLVCSVFRCHDLWRGPSRKMMIHQPCRRSGRSVSWLLVIIQCGGERNRDQACLYLEWPDDSIWSIMRQNDDDYISSCF